MPTTASITDPTAEVEAMVQRLRAQMVEEVHFLRQANRAMAERIARLENLSAAGEARS